MVEFEADILSEVIGCEGYHKKAPEFGSRAWVMNGKDVDVVYWDTGNGWCAIMQIIPKGDKELLNMTIKFYERLGEEIEKNYDEHMQRLD
ncbi:MAG: hypothetical protein AMJ90_04730 [candidate division Zixibacteria bacterium SM23_73_2]|nr:MAG: hypothetical protein AMJ90_04730 [candidate division Zixibacteria bacterium SM23_73_2]